MYLQATLVLENYLLNNTIGKLRGHDSPKLGYFALALPQKTLTFEECRVEYWMQFKNAWNYCCLAYFALIIPRVFRVFRAEGGQEAD